MNYSIFTLILLTSLSIKAYHLEIDLGIQKSNNDKNITGSNAADKTQKFVNITLENQLFSNFYGIGSYSQSLDDQVLSNGTTLSYQELSISLLSQTTYQETTISPSFGIAVFGRKNQVDSIVKNQPFIPVNFSISKTYGHQAIQADVGYDFFYFFPHNHETNGFRNVASRFHMGATYHYSHFSTGINLTKSTFKSDIGYDGPNTKGTQISFGYKF